MKELVNMTIIMILLGICTYFDLKEKKIPILPVLVSIILSVGFSLYQEDFTIGGFGAGLFLGVIFCLFSILSGGAFGIGDGLLATACGICLGFYETLALFFFAFLFTGLTGLALIMGKKKSGKAEMPLAPFLYGAYGIMCLLRA